MRELSAEATAGGESRLLSRYLKPDLLIIDDMGLKILPPKSGEILLEIIMRRAKSLPVSEKALVVDGAHATAASAGW